MIAGLALACAGCRPLATQSPVAFAPGPSLSEESMIAEELERSLTAFLGRLRRGEWSAAHTDPGERERYAFFYRSLMRGARDAEPSVLKSYPLDAGAHMITVAFVTGVPDALALSHIVELEAVPTQGGYRFRSPYEHNTAHLRRRTVGDVTYRFSGPFDAGRAEAFARFKAKLEGLQGREPAPLQYDCFHSLDELLDAFGLVHDASKCNSIRHDLGFLWDDGRRFATGTGDESYVFGYARGALSAGATDSEAVYPAYVNGAAVMCAFLYEEIAARLGEAAALRPVESGANGERFFSELEALIGVTRQNFHATIVRLIGAPG